MIPETGHFALILALVIALAQSVLPLTGALRGDDALMRTGRTAALAQFVFVAIAFACLATAYVQSDFSVINVFENSHTAKPLLYKISGVWGNHEGSMVLWVLILTIFGAAVALFGGNIPERLRAGADRILGAAIAEPHFIAGRGRFDTALLSAGGGRIFGKCGAEGVFAIGVRAYGARPPIGIAMKVEDGNKRAYEKALGALLAACRILERTDGDLAPFLAGALRNTRGLVVGRSVSRWDEDFDRDYERL